MTNFDTPGQHAGRRRRLSFAQAIGIGSVAAFALALAGCTADLEPNPLPPLEGAQKSAAARPLEAGLLSVSPDGTYALASDDVGESVYIVTLGTEQLVSRAVKLAPGDEPGRAVLSSTHAYVTLPRAGAVTVVDLQAASVVSRFAACASPEGIAIEGASLHVACRGGELVTLSQTDGHVERSLRLGEGLKDVLSVPSGLVVSRFATAELLWLDPEGNLLERTVPKVDDGSEPGVAWRMLLGPQGHVLLGHQIDSEEDLGDGYSGGECGSIAMPTVTSFAPPGAVVPGVLVPSDRAQQIRQFSISGGAGTFDLAVEGSNVVLVFPGNQFAQRYDEARMAEAGIHASSGQLPSVLTFNGEMDGGCAVAPAAQDDVAVPIAVAAPTAGPLAGRSLVLTHSPATVHVVDNADLTVTLHQEDRRNPGLELFQMTVGSGVSCASCHPGGRSDARTWMLANGPRRTQPLEGGVSQLGAFHWDAEFENFDDLLDDVMTDRMGLGDMLTADRKSSLLSFVDAIPRAVASASNEDAEAAGRGRALFESEATECTNCHGGPLFTNNHAFDVGTAGKFVTPSLVGVGYREPLMHDGCASDLTDRFGPCGGGDQHGKTSQLTDAEISDLVAYMKTL